jgi:hypothetical protein
MAANLRVLRGILLFGAVLFLVSCKIPRYLGGSSDDQYDHFYDTDSSSSYTSDYSTDDGDGRQDCHRHDGGGGRDGGSDLRYCPPGGKH